MSIATAAAIIAILLYVAARSVHLALLPNTAAGVWFLCWLTLVACIVGVGASVVEATRTVQAVRAAESEVERMLEP